MLSLEETGRPASWGLALSPDPWVPWVLKLVGGLLERHLSGRAEHSLAHHYVFADDRELLATCPSPSVMCTSPPRVPVPRFLCHLVPFNKRNGITFSSKGLGAFQELGSAGPSLLPAPRQAWQPPRN